MTPNPPRYFLDDFFFFFGVHSDCLFDLCCKRLEHIAPAKALSAIESEGVFVQIRLQILGADVVIDATNSVLGQAPKAFNRVRVRIAINVDFSGVMHAPVRIAKAGQWLIGVRFISENGRSWQDSLAKIRQERSLLCVSDDFSDYAPATLDGSPNCLLIASLRAVRIRLFLVGVLILIPSAEKAFVALDVTRQVVNVLVQHRTNLLEHSPRAFIRHADLALDLFGADSASRR